MGQLIFMPDTESVLATYLTAQLVLIDKAIPVGTRLENLPGTGLPPESVVLFRTGGLAGTVRSDMPLITVEARAIRESRAYEIANEVRTLLMRAGRDGEVLEGHQIYSVIELAGPGNLPDPFTSQPRYTATYQVHIAGVVIDSG